MEPIEFDSLDRVIVNVRIGRDQYLLKDTTEDQAVKFQNRATKTAKFQSGELSGVEGAGDLEPFLVSMCLVKVDAGGTETPVPVEVIRSWPSRVVKPLFNRAREISGFDEKDTVESIGKKMETLQKKLADLKKGDSDPKGLPDSTSTLST